jgi:uncharacterized damage-inducible protein DinB
MNNDLDSHPLLAIFRHNLWANARLFEFCTKLSEAQLAEHDPGAYGTLRATLEHLVRAEQSYVRRFTDQSVGERWPDDKRPAPTEMLARIQLTSQALIDCAARVQSGDTILVHWDNKAWPIPAGTILTQAINHATEHRTNITTILKRMGVEPPELDGWTYYLTVEAQQENR